MGNNINITVIAEDRIQAIESTLEEIKNLLQAAPTTDIDDKWIESKKVKQILGVSQKTWQTYRDKRLIPFTQIGHKIYVLKEDLDNFMNNHRISSKRK